MRTSLRVRDVTVLAACVLGAACSSDAPVAPPDAPASAPAAAPVVEGDIPADSDIAGIADYLIGIIEHSGLTFVRNGAQHTAAEAAAHVRDKYEHFRSEIHTVEDFVAKSASKSLLSGQPYLVNLPDGTQQPLGEWLLERWSKARAERDAAGR
ncbi:MAG TPA: DUF5329 family protein [Planctomycetota bacterium]|nr:DUF5329 family protein [Planctomycetota bacterium]